MRLIAAGHWIPDEDLASRYESTLRLLDGLVNVGASRECTEVIDGERASVGGWNGAFLGSQFRVVGLDCSNQRLHLPIDL